MFLPICLRGIQTVAVAANIKSIEHSGTPAHALDRSFHALSLQELVNIVNKMLRLFGRAHLEPLLQHPSLVRPRDSHFGLSPENYSQ